MPQVTKPSSTLRLTVGVLAGVTAILITYGGCRVAAYFLAISEDRECFGLSHRARSKIEACLSFYLARECHAKERIPGFNYAAGQCVSYEILGVESIQAIYDKDGNLIERISAYE